MINAVDFTQTLPLWEQENLTYLQNAGHVLTITENKRGVPRGLIRAYPATVEDLVANSWNPNSLSVKQSEALKNSLDELTQIQEVITRPCQVDPLKFEILDGEHRFNHLTDKIFINVIYGLSDAEAKLVTAVMDTTRGEFDRVKEAALLASIKDELGGIFEATLPYTENELSQLMKLAEIDWDQYEDSFTPDQQEKPEDIGAPSSEDEWRTLHIKVPAEAMDVIQQAHDLIADARPLHEDKAIAWGQVLECLAAEYLAIPTAYQESVEPAAT